MHLEDYLEIIYKKQYDRSAYYFRHILRSGTPSKEKEIPGKKR